MSNSNAKFHLARGNAKLRRRPCAPARGPPRRQRQRRQAAVPRFRRPGRPTSDARHPAASASAAAASPAAVATCRSKVSTSATMSKNSCWSYRRPCSTSATSFTGSSCSSAPEADSSAARIVASEGSSVLLVRRQSSCSLVGAFPAKARYRRATSLRRSAETCRWSACTSAVRSPTRRVTATACAASELALWMEMTELRP